MRREVGVEAFGINWFDLPSGQAGMEHDEAASGQEEVYVVVRGSGHWRIGDTEVPVREGSFIRVDPAEVDESGATAAEDAAWVAKYTTEWERFGMPAKSFAQRFSVPVRIRVSAVHGF